MCAYTHISVGRAEVTQLAQVGSASKRLTSCLIQKDPDKKFGGRVRVPCPTETGPPLHRFSHKQGVPIPVTTHGPRCQVAMAAGGRGLREPITGFPQLSRSSKPRPKPAKTKANPSVR